ncbi:phage tail sheath C-terminal domain-containing protein [Psychroserpens sp. AS72]|uniref:phage tail sheath family protein n=1 Tax=Psychroserpens sp. AS72 TaxID=3135775 RepID=UPI00316BE668
MAATYKAPGVYIEEVNAHSASITQGATAIPAFIGYTEKAFHNGLSVLNKPVRISSMFEFIQIFGEDFKSTFDILNPEPNETRPIINISGTDKVIDYANNNKAFMYKSLKFFYANGGDDCYIVSVGTYENQSSIDIDVDELLGTSPNSNPFEGLNALKNEEEPTIIVVPDAVNLSANNCYSLYQKVLEHCAEMKNRITILDIHNGFKARTGIGDPDDVITNFRTYIGTEYLSYGAAYYPWLHTITTPRSSITFENINLGLNTLAELLPETNVANLIEHYLELNDPTEVEKKDLNSGLQLLSPNYVAIIDGILEVSNVLPPSAAMAGIYTRVDADRGVWNAPANISVSNVSSPSVEIPSHDQQDLNVDSISGKSINAIRSFIGRGIIVWGARTLDGNSNEWRYINVKRTVLTIEESIKLAIRQFIFEPNTSNTWVAVQSMIENYLNAYWREGALAGATPRQAYGVRVGLGSTMTSLDIQEGNMIVEIFVAMIRPAEFIVVRFEQKMQTS